MKRVLTILIFCAGIASAQVGINTTSPSQAAALDISSSANNVSFGGLMPPRVTLAQRNAIPVSAADDGLMVLLTNGTQRCLQVYDGLNNMWQDVYCLNLVPVASAVAIAGTMTDGQLLTGSFNYSDPEGNPAGTHVYKWYRANNAAGSGAVEIAGATATTYTLTAADIGKHMAFEVTPVAAAGASPGTAAKSAYGAAVSAKPTIISFVQLSQNIDEDASPSTISLRFSYPNVSTAPVSVTVAASSYSRLTQGAPVTVVIPANTPSPYTIAVFNAKNNTADDGNANVTFTITNVSGGSGANSVGTPNTDTCTIADDEVTVNLTENFTNFNGTGFDPPPNTGRLDSDVWKIQGDIAQTNWGGTHTTGEPARGNSNGNVANNVNTLGAYRFNVGANRILGLKVGGEFYNGGIKVRVRNTTGATLTNWTVSYTLYRYNAGASGDLPIGLSYSTNDAAYTNIAAGSNTSAGTANTWTPYTYNINVTATVANNGYFYLYLEGFNEDGYQYADEFGIDNLSVTGRNF
jgi:hypothetical protein